MYQDPFDLMCYRIMTTITYFVMILALNMYYMYVSAKGKGMLAFLWLKCISIEVYYFVFKKCSSFYWKHIGPWLVVSGLKRAMTWAEVEQYRLEVSASCGREIPRSPDLEQGLKEEGYL